MAMHGFRGIHRFGSVRVAAPAALPIVGPFATLGSFPVSGLSDRTISANTTLTAGSAGTVWNNPLRYKNFTINAGVLLNSETYAVFIHCDNFALNGSINVSGDPAVEQNGGADGQAGGNGGSGGGGGGGGNDPDDGSGGGAGGEGGAGAGGDGTNGTAGGDNTDGNTFGGPGGTGWGTYYTSTCPYTFPIGGSSIDAGGSPDFTPTGPWGAGSMGSSGEATPGGQGGASGPGAGGYIGVFCNTISSLGVSNGHLVANGGNGTLPTSGSTGAAGGGVIQLAAKHKLAAGDLNYMIVSGGTVDIYTAFAGQAICYQISGTTLNVVNQFNTF